MKQLGPDVKFQHFIGGKDVQPSSRKYFESHDPSNGERLGYFAHGDKADVDAAVRSAYDGYMLWKNIKPSERGRILYRFAQLLTENADEFTHLESVDTGKPLRTARRDLDMSARYFEFYAGAVDKFTGDTIPASNDHLLFTVREPYGVTAHILPWNSPMNQLARGIAPALAMGNSVVVKPAEQTPVTTLYFAQLAIAAGLPPGAFNVVTGFGDAGDALARHPLSARITFTGSVETGRLVMHAGADRIVPVTAELGGKSPFIVFDDADLDKAAGAAVTAFVANCGQTCSAGSRLLIQRGIADKFVDKMTAIIAKTVTIGPGKEDPTIGSIVSQAQYDRVMSYIDIGQKEGARVACGGKRPAGDKYEKGFFVEPTIFVGVNNDMRIAREEIFGPVAAVINFEDESEAIKIANDTEYGLASAVWTRDVSRGLRVARQIEAGQVWINCFRDIDVEAPFGGYKNSGVGREKGLEALHHYTQVKTMAICI
ncbi:MAG: aldehyde dehydrogenase family protein [Bradyrhizobium sp.]